MRKLLYTFLILTSCLAFFSCADTLNETFPELSVPLSKKMDATYTSSSRNPTVSQTVMGKLPFGNSEHIYYFDSDSDCNYDITWKNYDNAKVAVSVSKYQNFSECVNGFENDISGSNSITVSSKMRVYIRVQPYLKESAFAGNYQLKVSGKSKSINLQKSNY